MHHHCHHLYPNHHIIIVIIVIIVINMGSFEIIGHLIPNQHHHPRANIILKVNIFWWTRQGLRARVTNISECVRNVFLSTAQIFKVWSGTYCEGADDENMNGSALLMILSVDQRNILGSLCFFMHPPALLCIVPERIGEWKRMEKRWNWTLSWAQDQISYQRDACNSGSRRIDWIDT